VRSEASGTLREKLLTLTADQLKSLTGEVEESTSEFFTGEGMSFPAQVIVVSGEKK
jgi:hypothetical protein